MENKKENSPQIAGTTSEDEDVEFIDQAIKSQNINLFICLSALVIALASLIITINEIL